MTQATDSITTQGLVRPCTPIKTLEHHSGVYKTPFIHVDRDVVEFPNSIVGEYSVVHQGEGFGAVVIPFTTFRGMGYIGLAREYRYPVGKELIGFPQGGTKDLSPEEAAREVNEELGLNPSSMIQLGTFHPDTGILSSTVGVWVALVHSSDVRPDHVEAITGLRQEWVSEGALEGLVLHGKIMCGVALAAYAMFRVKRSSFGPMT